MGSRNEYAPGASQVSFLLKENHTHLPMDGSPFSKPHTRMLPRILSWIARLVHLAVAAPFCKMSFYAAGLDFR